MCDMKRINGECDDQAEDSTAAPGVIECNLEHPISIEDIAQKSG